MNALASHPLLLCYDGSPGSKLAIETQSVAELIKANGVVPMLADWTDRSPAIKKALMVVMFLRFPHPLPKWGEGSDLDLHVVGHAVL